MSYGMAEYMIWYGMKNRCLNSKARNFKFYGGRGITIDPRWMDFVNFYIDMGIRPSTTHSLHRIDNNGPYSKDNCKWATKEEQIQGRSKHYKIKSAA